jgi:hypothetical protein
MSRFQFKQSTPKPSGNKTQFTFNPNTNFQPSGPTTQPYFPEELGPKSTRSDILQYKTMLKQTLDSNQSLLSNIENDLKTYQTMLLKYHSKDYYNNIIHEITNNYLTDNKLYLKQIQYKTGMQLPDYIQTEVKRFALNRIAGDTQHITTRINELKREIKNIKLYNKTLSKQIEEADGWLNTKRGGRRKQSRRKQSRRKQSRRKQSRRK